VTVKALILEPDHSARLRFRKFTEVHPAFSRCTASATLSEGGDRLRSGATFDAIYISTRFDPTVVSYFMEATRTVHKSESAAQIIVVTPGCPGKNIKTLQAGKPDGYLLEPHSQSDLDGSVEFISHHRTTKTEPISGTPDSPLISNPDSASPAKPESTTKVAVNIKALCARIAVAIDLGNAGLKDLRELSKRVELLDENELLQYYDELIKYMSDFRKPVPKTSEK
jgi:hypothetical protein